MEQKWFFYKSLRRAVNEPLPAGERPSPLSNTLVFGRIFLNRDSPPVCLPCHVFQP